MDLVHKSFQMDVTTQENIKTVSHREKEPISGITDKFIRGIGKKEKDMGQEYGKELMVMLMMENGGKESQMAMEF